jgi:hypothetical protein
MPAVDPLVLDNHSHMRAGAEKSPRCDTDRHEEKRNTMRTQHALFAAGFLILLLATVLVRPITGGDASEYLHMTHGWINHWSPDLRPEDGNTAEPILEAMGYTDYAFGRGYYGTDNGRLFSSHFWLYSLAMVPATLFMRLIKGNEFAAFQLTNVLFFMAAIAVALRYGEGNRFVFLGLSVLSPVLWYLRWPGPEVYTWSFVSMSLALATAKRYSPAALCAALAATQNQSLVFLVAFIVFLALNTGHLATIASTVAAGLFSLAPVVFTYAFYGHLSPFTAFGLVDPSLISPQRTTSFLFDLNQGMLPYVPFLLVSLAAVTFMIATRRDFIGLCALITIAFVILPTEAQPNWNGGQMGMARYAVWVVPICAWLVSQHVPSGRNMNRLFAVVFAVEVALLTYHSNHMNYLTHTPLAAYILETAPALYDPDPEIFAERLLEYDGVELGNAHTKPREPAERSPLPIAFVSKTGDVTKILSDVRSLEILPTLFTVEAPYLDRVRLQHTYYQNLFYLNPPRGAVRTR